MKTWDNSVVYILLICLFLSSLSEAAAEVRKTIYAKKPLFSSRGVVDPYHALFETDGKYARINYLGHLDLELTDFIENAGGPDVEITTIRLREERIFGTMVFQVFVKEYEAEVWTFVGTAGVGGQDTFDFKGLKRVKYVRIYYINPYFFIYPPDVRRDEIGVDSVKSRY